MTPERAVRETDEIGERVVSEYMAQVMGRTNAFTIARPSDRLRNRLLAEQGLDPEAAALLLAATNAPPPLPDPLVLTLADALRVGAANDNGYQSQKETLFSEALALDLVRHDFETTFAGVLSGGATRTGSDTDGGGGGASATATAATTAAAAEGEVATSRSSSSSTSSSARGGAKASLSRKFRNGATLAASLGLDIVKLLSGGGGRTLGLTGDASVTVPLLRGGGRLVATEALTQAERNMVYAVYSFEKFRQGFAIDIAAGYYGMLKVEQQLIALRENNERLTANYERAKLLFEAGRLSQVELDQTRQDLLSTGDQLVSAQKARQSTLDDFKMKLGLPVDARIELDMGELDRLGDRMGLDLSGTNATELARQPELPWTEDEAVAIALSNRYDLIVGRMKLGDTERALVLAADALRGTLGLTVGGDFGRTKASGGTTRDSHGLSASFSSDLPWERTAERNAYRAALIALDVGRRALDTEEDATRQLVRDDIRSINSAWSSFVIQREALTVAQRRVRSTTLFQQAGRSSTRDLLESEAALLSARNAVVGAVVEYRLAGLKLLRDLSLLAVTEEGLLLEDED